MKKLLILSLGIAFLGYPLESKSELAGDTIICPSGDKYICLDSHGELGTVYRGKGKVLVIE